MNGRFAVKGQGSTGDNATYENKNITCVIASMLPGGAERVMSLLVEKWILAGNSVTLITLRSSNQDFFPLSNRVQRIGLDVIGESKNVFEALRNNLIRIKKLRRTIRDSSPDVVISFVDITNILTLIATRGLRIPVIISERNDPGSFMIGKAWTFLRRKIYPYASAVVVQTEAVKNQIEKFVVPSLIHVIPNPVDIRNMQQSSDSLLYKSRYNVVALGRLNYVKGYDVLVRAFAGLHNRNTDWDLTIIGEGPERNELERLVDEFGKREVINLPGVIHEPWGFLKQADLFVLSSRSEGFPNALLEAMACGLPVVSSDCPHGPREIVRNGIDGLLVPPDDVTGLSGAMETLMKNESLRLRLSRRAREVIWRFGIDQIMEKWEETISQVIGC